MVEAKNMIPVLPSSILPDNSNAIDWGSCGIACFATGSSIHFFDVEKGQIKQLYSYDFRPSVITVVKFHSISRWMAFGDDIGNLLFWDVEKRGSMCSILPYSANSKCLDICWQGNSVIALFSNNHLVQFSYNPNSNTENLRRIEVNWDITLKANYSRISFDPHQSGLILLSSSAPHFSVYQYTPSSGMQRPKPFYESVELSCTDFNIQDAQWAEHFPGFIWVVLENEIVFFHIESKTLIQMIRQRASASSFSRIYQLRDDHRKFVCLHRNGLISIFEANKNTNNNNNNNRSLSFSVAKEIQAKHGNSVVLQCVKNRMTDREIFLVYSGLGPALLDLDRNIVVNTCFNYPVTITSADCDDEIYVIGTNTGIVQICQLNLDLEGERHRRRRFLAIEGTPVDFVGISCKINKIYFKGRSAIGEIRLDTNRVVLYNSRAAPATRCISTKEGAFVVQRENRVLGIFVNGQEKPALLQSDIVDIALKEPLSGPLGGEVGVLLRSKEIIFIKYNIEEGIVFMPTKFAINAPIAPIAMCYSVAQLIIAFDNGNLLTHEFQTKKTKSTNILVSNVSTMRFCENKIFGLAGNCNLFVIDNQDGFRTCPNPVQTFVPVSPEIVFVIGQDKIARFIRISDWRQLSAESKILQPDSFNVRVARHIENHPIAKLRSMITNEELVKFDENIDLPKHELPEESLEGFGKETPWFSPDMRNVWMILRENVPLMLQGHCGAGETGEFEQAISTLYSAVQYVAPEFLLSKFSSALFADKFDEAVQILVTDGPTEKDLFKNATLAGCVIACSNSNNSSSSSNSSEAPNISDKMLIHLKSVAISLMLQGSYEEGSILFRIARLDRIASEYLMEHDQLDLALKFIRGCLKNPEEKEEMLMKLGVKYTQKGNKGLAVLVFASCGIWHLVLGLLRDMGKKLDVFFLKKYCIYRGILKPMPKEMEKVFPDILPLIPLIAQIDIDFAEYATDVGVTSNVLKVILS